MPRQFTDKERMTIEAVLKRLGVQLNEGQKVLAFPSDRPKLTSAGPGAGKTTTLGVSVALIELIEKIPGKFIHVMTFTNKATDEFEARHAKLMAKLGLSSFVQVSTIHAFCKKFVNVFRGDLGFLEINILDENESFDVLKMVYKNVMGINDFNVNVSEVKKIEACIAFLNNRLLFNRDEIEKTAQFIDLKMDYNVFENIRIVYSSTQRRNEQFSFDEIMLLMYELVTKNKDVSKAIQSQIGALFVDEFQDTTLLQMEIINACKAPNTHLIVVGDPNQSIYRWRGASKVYTRFKQLYPNYEHAKLEINYRCPDYAVLVSNALIRNNEGSDEFKVVGTGKKGKVEIIGVQSNTEACKEIAKRIIGEYVESGRDNYTLSNKLVLYRNHNQAMFLIYELAKNRIPINTSGVLLPHKDKIAKDIFAICEMLENPRDGKLASENLFKVITQFNKPKDLTKCLYYNSEDTEHFANVKVHIKNYEEYQSEMGILVKTAEMIKKGEKASDIFKQLLPLYMKAYYKKFNLASLFGKTEEDVMAIQRFLYEGMDQSYNIDQFIYECEQVEKFVRQSVKDSVGITLLTVHSAKGLEAEKVYLLDMNGSVQPNMRTLEELRKKKATEAIVEHIEEERSIAFVAMTRTLKDLVVTYNVNNPSPFNLESGLNLQRKAEPNRISLETLGLGKGDKNMRPQQQQVRGATNSLQQMSQAELQAMNLLSQGSKQTSDDKTKEDLFALSKAFSLDGASKEREVKQSGFQF